MSSLNIEEFFSGGVVETDSRSSQEVVALLKTKMKSRKVKKAETTSAASGHSVLRKAEIEQVRQALKALSSVHTHAASDARMAQRFFPLLREKVYLAIIFSGSTFLQSILTRKKAGVKTSLPQSAPEHTRALFLLHGMGYVSSCQQYFEFHARLHCKKVRRTEKAGRLLTRARSALFKCIGLEKFQTAYRPSFVYDRRAAMSQAIVSSYDGDSLCSQQYPLDGVENSVSTKKKVDKAVKKRSETMKHAMRLLTSEFFSHLNAPFPDSSLYVLDDDKPLGLNAVFWLHFTATFFLLSTSHSHEVVQPLHIEGAAVESSSVIELEDEESTVRFLATCAEFGLSLENHWSLEYIAEALRLGSTYSCFVTKRKDLYSVIATARWRRKVMRNSLYKEGVRTRVESFAGVRAITDGTSAVPGPLQPKADCAFQMLVIAVREYYFVKDTALSAPEDLRKLKRRSALRQFVNLRPFHPPYSTRRVRGQDSSAHNVISQESI